MLEEAAPETDIIYHQFLNHLSIIASYLSITSLSSAVVLTRQHIITSLFLKFEASLLIWHLAVYIVIELVFSPILDKLSIEVNMNKLFVI
jgi:hypothetical protein